MRATSYNPLTQNLGTSQYPARVREQGAKYLGFPSHSATSGQRK